MATKTKAGGAHYTRVAEQRGGGWLAKCSCGWTASKARTLKESARGDAIRHTTPRRKDTSS